MTNTFDEISHNHFSFTIELDIVLLAQIQAKWMLAVAKLL